MSGSGLEGDLLFVNFNQDNSCISVGTRDGYAIFSCDPFGKTLGKSDGGFGIVEMLFSTSLLALVGAGEQPAFSPRRLRVYNSSTKTAICELNFVTAILAVRMNRKRLVVVLETKIHVLDLATLKVLHTLDTPPNPKGVCALSSNSDNCYLAVPASPTTGDVLIFDALNLVHVAVIQPAHKTLISQLAFNFEGTLLATASEKGTVMRVFSVPQGTKLHTLRRGTTPARLHCLSFNLLSTLLCVASDTGTVHIFRLDHPSASHSHMSHYLPEMINDIWEPTRSFAHIRLATQGIPYLCAINSTNTMVLIVSTNGRFFQCALDPINGGECRIVREHTLVPESESEGTARFL